MNELHGLLFAYRSNANLAELTRPRNTCSLPFGGRYRLIDFMLSNYVNAGIKDVGVIVHQSYQSLLDHLGSGKDWDLSRKLGGMRILPPFSYAEHKGEYRGNMDALAGVATYLKTIRRDYVIMGWGDIAINLPVSAVLEQHLATSADITIVCTPTLRGTPHFSEYIETDTQGRITDISVHPSVADKPLESLGIYVLSRQLLLDLVEHCAAHNIAGLSSGVLQPSINRLKLMAYVHKGYAGRFQSVGDYYHCSMDLLNPAVRADLLDPARPIRTKDVPIPSTYYSPEGQAINSLVADGCMIEGRVENSLLSRGVTVEKGAQVANCVLMQGTIVRKGASLAHVITDKNVVINENHALKGHESYPLAIAKNSVV